jgi:hypothetical protein
MTLSCNETFQLNTLISGWERDASATIDPFLPFNSKRRPTATNVAATTTVKHLAPDLDASFKYPDGKMHKAVIQNRKQVFDFLYFLISFLLTRSDAKRFKSSDFVTRIISIVN